MNEFLNFWLGVKGVSQIIELFEKEKHDIRFVGGCVRDALLGIKSSDIDFAISCHPDTTARILYQNKIEFSEYGRRYGTITAIIGKNFFEITSLREDKNQTGRDTEVLFTNDWNKDALRRDFTFNAININSEGKIEDYFNGKIDLELKTIKFIGNVEERIHEDYLRILRYFRFLGLFNNPKIIDGYQDIFYKNLHHLRYHVSNDQIRNELLKMLKNKFTINSIVDLKNNKKTNTLINSIKKWWIEDQYILGLDKCMNRIEALIINQ